MLAANKPLDPSSLEVEDLDFDAPYGGSVVDDTVDDKEEEKTKKQEAPKEEAPVEPVVEPEKPKEDPKATESPKTDEASTPTGEEEFDDENADVYSIIAKHIGIELDPNESFDDSYEGMAKFVETYGSKIGQQHIDDELGTIPDVIEYYRHRKNGGDPESFFQTNYPEVDYSSIDLDTASKDTMKQLLKENFKSQGLSDDDIKSAVESAEAGGVLKQFAGIAKNALINKQNEAKKNFANEQAAIESQRKAAALKLQQDVASALESTNDLHGVHISNKDKQALINYVLQPVNAQGQTQRDIDAANMSITQALALAQLIRSGFNLEKVISSAVSTKQAQSLRERLNKQNKTKSSSVRLKASQVHDYDPADLDTGT